MADALHVDLADWSKRGVYGAPARFGGPVRYIVGHHAVTNTAGKTALQQVREVDDIIARRGGFAMFAYSFAVPTVGSQVYTGRGFHWQNGANRDPKGVGIGNYNSVSYVLPGNYEHDTPTDLQLELMARSIAAGVKAGHIAPDFIVVPHRQVHATACPGANLVPHLAHVQARARELLNPTTSSTTGEPMPNTPFTDVPAGAYYRDAAAWAYEHKISTGTSATTFGGDDPADRGAVITFLHRFWTKILNPRFDNLNASISAASSKAADAASGVALLRQDLEKANVRARSLAEQLAATRSAAVTAEAGLLTQLKSVSDAVAALEQVVEGIQADPGPGGDTGSQEPPTGRLVTFTIGETVLAQVLDGSINSASAEARVA